MIEATMSSGIHFVIDRGRLSDMGAVFLSQLRDGVSAIERAESPAIREPTPRECSKYLYLACQGSGVNNI
jgi:hypothetical protein